MMIAAHGEGVFEEEESKEQRDKKKQQKAKGQVKLDLKKFSIMDLKGDVLACRDQAFALDILKIN